MNNTYSDISINDRPRISLNYASGNDYDSSIVYGLYKGQYIIKNIPEERPIAIINKDENNTKEDCIRYFGTETFKKTRLGPDGKTMFDYFYHTLIIQVFGDFGKVSIYEYNDGFCGGENLLMYSESFSDISSEFQSWYDIYDETVFQADCSSISVSGDVIDNMFTSIYQVSSYINCDISLDSNGDNALLFDDISNSLTKYCFDTGNFVLMNVPASNPIAFLNKEREDLFSYDGYYVYSTTGTASDGNTYTYYYGNINITVTGDFGQLTFETFSDSYMGGFRKLMFNSGDESTKGEAVHHWGVNTYYDMLTSDPSDTPQNYYINVRTNTRAIHYSEDYVTYRFAGYDRNGVIDSEEDNPELTFAIGDIVYFTFENNYEQPFGIYTYHNLLTDEQLITNNSNNTSSQISWIPNLVISNYYYYRAEKYVTNFMTNTINIINNENAEIILDIESITTSPEVTSTTTNYVVTVNAKTNNHPYYSDPSGSTNAFYLNGEESPLLEFVIGQTYTFDQSDSTNSGHPLLFYEDASKQLIYSTNVTINGTAGSYDSSVTIDISSSTPSPLYYQCGNHNLMGYKAEIVSESTNTDYNNFTVLMNSFTINFDEVVNINSSRNLYLYNVTTNTIDITIPATQLTQNTQQSATYTTGFSKYNVSSLEFDTSYALLMDEELFENIYYNTISGEIETYLDISAYNLLQFGTETRHEPTFVSITPDSSSTLVDVSGYIEIEFDEPVVVPADADVPGGNNIAFVDSDNNSIDYTSYESSGNKIYVYYGGLNYNTVYSVSFDDYSIVDLSNIQFTISDSSLSDYSIQTIEDPRPQLQYFIPNNNISNVYVDQPISLIFSEVVYLDTSSNGRIQIEDVSNGTVFDYFDVSNNDDVSGIIFGNGTNTLRIYPFDADLSFADNSTYTLSIDSDVIKDVCDNYYPGISTSDSNPITFTTGDTAGDAQESLASETSGNIVSDDSGNNYIVFNSDTSYEEKQFTLSVGTYTIDISESYPFTILNGDISNIVVISISNDTIEIDVSSGSVRDATTGDYFVFTNSDGETISLANGDLKFMRDKLYI